MAQLELDRNSIYHRVEQEMNRAGMPALSSDQVTFISDVILEEMRRQYLERFSRG